MATEFGVSRTVNWADTRSRRTEAVPKHSLFGTGLELLSEEDKREADRLYVQKKIASENAPNTENSFKYIGNSGNDFLKTCKEDLQLQKTRMKLAQENLRQKELEAKYAACRDVLLEKSFKQQNCTDCTRTAPYATNDFSIQDSKTVHYVNDRKLASHLVTAPYATSDTKSRINSPIAKLKPTSVNVPEVSMQHNFRQSNTEHSAVPVMYRRNRAVGLHHVPKEYFMEEMRNRKVDIPQMAVELPRNILHQFRTNICAELLSDADKVHTTQWAINKDNRRYLLPKLTASQQEQNQYTAYQSFEHAAEDEQENPHEGYDSLGQVGRTNVFPGTADPIKVGTTHRDYSSALVSQRQPVTDKYRNRTDDLAKWAESNIYRQRIMKAWDQYELEKKDSKKKITL